MGGKKQTDMLTEQGTEELTLEDIDDSVQRLIQLVVFLPQTLSGATLVLVSVVEFGPVLLQELQGSLGIYKIINKAIKTSHPTVTLRLQNSPTVMKNKLTQ